MKVLFVCTGNTCRSPMLEFAFKRYLSSLGINDIEVDSAGVLNHEKPMSEQAQRVLEANAVPYDKRVSRLCTEREICEADIVITMTDEQAEQLKNKYYCNKHCNNIISMREAAGYEISDPYGQGLDVYEKTYALINGALPKILQYLKK